MFAKIKNNQVVEWPIVSLVPLFPNTSLPSPITDSNIPEGYAIVHASAPPITSYTQKALPDTPVYVDNKWVQGWRIQALTEAELQDLANVKKSQRAAAYTQESDPLFFKWQRGEATEAEWLAKIQEIKDRFPDLE